MSLWVLLPLGAVFFAAVVTAARLGALRREVIGVGVAADALAVTAARTAALQTEAREIPVNFPVP